MRLSFSACYSPNKSSADPRIVTAVVKVLPRPSGDMGNYASKEGAQARGRFRLGDHIGTIISRGSSGIQRRAKMKAHLKTGCLIELKVPGVQPDSQQGRSRLIGRLPAYVVLGVLSDELNRYYSRSFLEHILSCISQT